MMSQSFRGFTSERELAEEASVLPLSSSARGRVDWNRWKYRRDLEECHGSLHLTLEVRQAVSPVHLVPVLLSRDSIARTPTCRP